MSKDNAHEMYEQLLKNFQSIHALSGIHWRFSLLDHRGTKVVLLHSFWRDKDKTVPGDDDKTLVVFCRLCDILGLRITLWCNDPRLLPLYMGLGFRAVAERDGVVDFIREPGSVF